MCRRCRAHQGQGLSHRLRLSHVNSCRKRYVKSYHEHDHESYKSSFLEDLQDSSILQPCHLLHRSHDPVRGIVFQIKELSLFLARDFALRSRASERVLSPIEVEGPSFRARARLSLWTRGFRAIGFVSARLCESPRPWSLSPVAIYKLKTTRRRPGHDLELRGRNIYISDSSRIITTHEMMTDGLETG